MKRPIEITVCTVCLSVCQCVILSWSECLRHQFVKSSIYEAFPSRAAPPDGHKSRIKPLGRATRRESRDGERERSSRSVDQSIKDALHISLHFTGHTNRLYSPRPTRRASVLFSVLTHPTTCTGCKSLVLHLISTSLCLMLCYSRSRSFLRFLPHCSKCQNDAAPPSNKSCHITCHVAGC